MVKKSAFLMFIHMISFLYMTTDIRIMKKACKILRIEALLNHIFSIDDVLD